MLIEQGRTETLAGRQWVAVELTSEARVEEVMLHIVRWVKRTMRGTAFQLVFPVESRELDGVRMLSPYLLARTKDLGKLAGVRAVMGVQGLVSSGDGQPIKLDDEFAQQLIGRAKEAAAGWSRGVKRGSFVRILMGSQRMLVGKVAKLDGRLAEVVVSLRLRNVRLRVNVGALQNLGKEEREYFYGGR